MKERKEKKLYTYRTVDVILVIMLFVFPPLFLYWQVHLSFASSALSRTKRTKN